MMECKKALTERRVISPSRELLRIRAGPRHRRPPAHRRGRRDWPYVAPDAKTAAMVEVNCETDFVARTTTSVRSRPKSRRSSRATSAGSRCLARVRLPPANGRARRTRSCRNRREPFACAASRERFRGKRRLLLHGSRIGVLVDVTGAGHAGQGSAMHVAASKPVAVSRDGVPADVIERERKIKAAQAAESGKPANIVEKWSRWVRQVLPSHAAGPAVRQGRRQADGGELVKSQGVVRPRLRPVRGRRRHREEERRFRGGSGRDDQGLIPPPRIFPPQPERSSPP